MAASGAGVPASIKDRPLRYSISCCNDVKYAREPVRTSSTRPRQIGIASERSRRSCQILITNVWLRSSSDFIPSPHKLGVTGYWTSHQTRQNHKDHRPVAARAGTLANDLAEPPRLGRDGQRVVDVGGQTGQ
jgi:hypothetical protein